MKRFLLPLLFAMPLSAAATTPLWLRDAKISPDGSLVAFCYKGDIYTVPTTGGQAYRVTSSDHYDSSPIWSPDSRKIAYATDRNGNFDVYIIDAAGGTPTRLTYNSASEIPESFTPDGKAVLYSAAIQDPAGSALFPTVRMTELYSVPTGGGASVQVLGTPARFVSFLADGKSFLYQDVKGFEDEWRKHHTSSVTRDVWLYDAAEDRHTNLTNIGGENLNPVMGEGSDYYFLSERRGSTMNVYKASLKNRAAAEAITSFKTHPVRFLSRANNGTLAFTYDGEIYTMPIGKKPAKLAINIVEDATPDIQKLAVKSGARSGKASPNGKSIAFIYRGDVFVTNVEYGTTRQISATAEAESDVCWAPDGKALYYASERDGRYNIYKATVARSDEEPGFEYATLIKEEAMFKADKHERGVPQVAPDGKKLAFLLDREILAVLDIESGKVKQLTDGSTEADRNNSISYAWSPDSKWIALEIVARKHAPYSDIALINVETTELTNITNSGYIDAMPRWTMDGNAIMYASERFGMRNHASWGTQMDVMLVFLNQKAFDEFVLSKEELALLKDAKKSKKESDKKDGDKKNDDKKADDAKDKKDKKKVEDIVVELDEITDRIVRVTPQSTDLHDAMFTSDGETLYYLANYGNKYQLWKLSPREEEHKMVSNLSGPASFDISADSKNIFLLGSTMRRLDTKSDKLKSISYSGKMTLDHAAEREFMFDNMTREVAERFYVKDMHGVDWPNMTKHYHRFLPHINNNYDYAEMLSELLGELNVSHTGGRFSNPGSSQADRTASLGLIYDLQYTGDGLKVAEVIEKGPFATASTKVAAGTIIESINGTKLNPSTDLATLLTDLTGQRTLVSLYNPGSGERWDEVIKPISSSKQNALLYRRWVKGRAAAVDSLSNGRLGYVHISSMADGPFREVYSDILGKYNDREGIVIDIRWNGGGRLHEDIEVLFSGKKYFTQEVRGKEICDMPSRRWNKPSIMLMAEPCYSNAHGTPWVYKHRGIGSLVGMPVPGTMTSVNWVTMQDRSLVYGIPVVGYHLPDGSFLENQQLEPDIKVANDPAEIVKGIDRQLETAVKELLRQIDSK